MPQEESEAVTQSYDIDQHEEFDEDEPSAELVPSDTSNSSSASQPASAPSPSASTTIQFQPTSVFVKPKTNYTAKKRKSQPAITPTDKAFIDFCSQQIAVPETVDSPRKMFLLSLLSDVESMTDHQYRKFRMDVLPLIDNILLYSPTSSQVSGTSSEGSGISTVPSSPHQMTTLSPVDRPGTELLLNLQQYQPPSSDWWQHIAKPNA